MLIYFPWVWFERKRFIVSRVMMSMMEQVAVELEFRKLVTVILKSSENIITFQGKILPTPSRQHQCHGYDVPWCVGGRRAWLQTLVQPGYHCNYTQQSVGTSADTCSALQRLVGLRPSPWQHLQHCSNLQEVTPHCSTYYLWSTQRKEWESC